MAEPTLSQILLRQDNAPPVVVTDPAGIRNALAFQKAQGRLRRPRRIARRFHNRRPEAEYFRALAEMVDRMREVVAAEILPQIPSIVAEAPPEVQPQQDRADQFGERLAQVIEGVRLIYGTILTIEDPARAAAMAVSANNGTIVKRAAQAALAIRPELSETWLAPMLDSFTRRNAKLVTQVSEQFVDRLEERIAQGVQQGLRAEVIQREIQRDFVTKTGADARRARKRAKLIARDQVASLAGDVNRVRQQQLGVTRYVWRTSQDERVRDSHRQRDGKVFEWGKPIEPQLRRQGLTVDKIDGPPGRPINCRCIAEPVLQDLLGDLPELDGTGAPQA